MAEETNFPCSENIPMEEAYEVPPLTLRPNREPLEYGNHDTYKFIVLDLETTGLERTSEICQIAVVGSQIEDQVWLTYILPDSNISIFATAVNGLSITHVNNERRLMKGDNLVEASSPKDGFAMFLAHLKTHANPGVKIVLIAHNGKQFDSRILCNNFHYRGIAPEKLEELGVVFSDSLPLIRELRTQLHPSLLVEGKPIESMSLPIVYHHIFKEEHRAHDAGNDVQALRRLLFHSSLDITPQQILAHSFTVLSAWKLNIFLNRSRKHFQTMKGTLYHPYNKEQSVITHYMAKKIAESGLGYSDLQKIYTMQGREGIVRVFQSPRPLDVGMQRPQARVTYVPQIIQAVIAHFESPPVSDSDSLPHVEHVESPPVSDSDSIPHVEHVESPPVSDSDSIPHVEHVESPPVSDSDSIPHVEHVESPPVSDSDSIPHVEHVESPPVSDSDSIPHVEHVESPPVSNSDSIPPYVTHLEITHGDSPSPHVEYSHDSTPTAAGVF